MKTDLHFLIDMGWINCHRHFSLQKTDMGSQVAVVDRLILYFESFCMKTCQCTAHEDWFLRDNFDQHHTMYKNSVGWLSHMSIV